MGQVAAPILLGHNGTMKPALLLVPLLIAAFALTEAALVAAMSWMPDMTPPRPDCWPSIVLNAIIFAQVSLAVLWGGMVRLSVGWRLALAVTVPALGGLTITLIDRGRQTLSLATFFLVMQAVAFSAILAIASVAGLSFGRMRDDADATSAGRARWQTSIGSLLLLTTTTAVSLSLLKWLIRLDDLAFLRDVWIIYAVLCAGNLALIVGMASAVLATGRWWLRAAVFVAGLAGAAASYWTLIAGPFKMFEATCYVAFQAVALAIGLAAFRGCGWSIARRRNRV
jgi:hypothetical protein